MFWVRKTSANCFKNSDEFVHKNCEANNWFKYWWFGSTLFFSLEKSLTVTGHGSFNSTGKSCNQWFNFKESGLEIKAVDSCRINSLKCLLWLKMTCIWKLSLFSNQCRFAYLNKINAQHFFKEKITFDHKTQNSNSIDIGI